MVTATNWQRCHHMADGEDKSIFDADGDLLAEVAKDEVEVSFADLGLSRLC